jgi:chorismate mutase
VDDVLSTLMSGALGPGPLDAAATELVTVRVATSCTDDSVAAIAAAVTELVTTFHARNDCGPDAVRIVLFTATPDLRAGKPATPARAAGWHQAQLLCLAEMPTDDDFPRCIRALLFVARGRGADPLKPVYLNGTQRLRPDLVAE